MDFPVLDLGSLPVACEKLTTVSLKTSLDMVSSLANKFRRTL
jgi:hypothetical protein